METKRYYFGYYPGYYSGYPEGWMEDFEYCVEIDYDFEMIRIKDACNRSIPVGFEDIDKLIRVLTTVVKKIDTADEAND